MGIVQVKKVIAVCFLEAVKLALEHLGTYRLEMSQHGVVGSPELPRLYGEARRLRDYLQRCASAYQDMVDLDLADSDRGLLVACCRRLVESVDLRLTGEQLVPSEERQYLTKKRDIISDWTVELASKPLMELPLPKLSPVQTDCSRGLMSRLANKLFGPGKLPVHMHGESQALGAPALIAAEPAAAAPADPGVAVDAQLLDTQTIRDPRLRGLAAMDLRSYVRAMQAQDHRIAAVLLASILEAAILDHAIPRREELGLPGTPDGWNPLDVLGVALGDKLAPQDRSLAYHLFASRNLLRPGLQVVTPTVVTVSSLERLREFVLRALRAMGFASGGSPASANASSSQAVASPAGVGPMG
ncbi:MAG: hypothetical protein Q7T30_04590 [Planctomycetota bacterium]|nr:hypothetical protein [Planctomycetota bacterium]